MLGLRLRLGVVMDRCFRFRIVVDRRLGRRVVMCGRGVVMRSARVVMRRAPGCDVRARGYYDAPVVWGPSDVGLAAAEDLTRGAARSNEA